MNYVIAVLISLAVLYYVLSPLFRRKYRFVEVPGIFSNSPLDSLLHSKNEVLRAIKEIEFEYQMGKISAEDYETLRADYQRKALEILQEIDRRQQGGADDDPLEKQIRLYRQSLKGEASKVTPQGSCPACGKPIRAEFKFCIYCGESLSQP